VGTCRVRARTMPELQRLEIARGYALALICAEILHDTRKLCPKCERALVLRTAGGPDAGKQFWGC
jgi:hypothetical protein